MKDRKGHGSNKRGGSYNEFAAAHEKSMAQPKAQTPEDHIKSGGELPTEAQYDSLESVRESWLKGWGEPTTDAGRAAVARIHAELANSRALRAKYGSKEKPTALTIKLRGGK